MGNGNCIGSVPIIVLDVRAPTISELYTACEVGNVEQVRKLLADMPFFCVNCSEPNGSTALHAASANGHVDVVRLLVQEYGVIRHRKNSEGLIAYEVAANDDIRQIFHRPKTSDYFNSTVTGAVLSLFAMFFPSSKRPPPPWINNTSGWLKTRYVGSKLKNGHIPSPFEIENETKQLQLFVNAYIKPSHTKYKIACQCMNDYREKKKVEELLRIYTLDMPFCSNICGPMLCHVLLNPLIRHLDALSNRYFQGTSYRGLTMTKEDLEDYEEALRQEKVEQKESVITLASFASTSIDEVVATGFAVASTVENKITVLITCIFPERCDTAIALYKISESIPCISHFDDEEEVLVFPGTMFRVTKIGTTTDPSLAHIHLTNVVPKFHAGAVVLNGVKQEAIKALVPSIFL
ncbi:unnamed protein product [Adineta steineri]|uniref:Uncharacterized protein n=1 Tax=Adineta steineri TaxID=433720 RepID=A0A819MJ05_9BILA|nr:unnamed protein product [Adineta steineri]CAF3981075.1 unnamed protein product [Adineta steineri]